MSKRNNRNMTDNNVAVLDNPETVTDVVETVESSENTFDVVAPLAETVSETVSEEKFQPTSPDYNAIAEQVSKANIKEGDVIAYTAFTEGRLTEREFFELTGEDVNEYAKQAESEQEAEAAKKPGIGHNKAPEIDAAAEDVKEEISHYKPQVATDSAKATEMLRMSLDAALEWENRGQTSIRSDLAISVADYVYTNTEGLGANGNKLFHVSRKLYDDLLKNIGQIVDKDDWSSSLKTTVGYSIELAVLLMSGKARIGWFILPPDRKAVRQNDVAVSEYPSNVPAGHKIMRSVCVPSNVLQPKATAQIAGGQSVTVENNSTELVLLPLHAGTAMYKALWDKDGELAYDPLTGRITGFTSGKDVAAKVKAEAEKAAKAKAEAAKAASQPASNTPEQPQGRETGGTQAELVTSHEATIRQLLNKDQLSRDDMAKLRDHYSAMMAEHFQMRSTMAQWAKAQEGDILAAIPAIRAEIRVRGSNLPNDALVGLVNDAEEAVIRCVYPKADKALPSDVVASLVRLHRKIGNILIDGEEGKVIQQNVAGSPISTFEVN